MKYLEVAVVIFICISCYIDVGESIKCHVCNSFETQQCGDEFSKDNTDFLMDCPTNYTMCRKIVQNVFYEDDWNLRYIRECAKTGEVEDTCRERTGTYKVKVKYCHCGSPECNGVAQNKINFMAALIPLFVVALITFKKL
ncbi:uncharacterized protein LOC127707500 [Mytilus californianus]|uniref:uncharacterized protein LOC127707500 n=1 Tax=Mytilus californianus TaxID=6549 RepID=UPI002245AD5F|nr:uncharacterized protein LOC127707500 [Mytilus californianus]